RRPRRATRGPSSRSSPLGRTTQDQLIRASRVVDRFVALVDDIVENLLDQPVDQDFAANFRHLSSPLTLGRRNDRIELVLQPAGQVVKVWIRRTAASAGQAVPPIRICVDNKATTVHAGHTYRLKLGTSG